VKKRWYSVDAAETAFDITTKQPQLFVCRDFKHLTDVLEEFASRMAFRIGGLEGINKAIACKNTTTCEFSSGLQVSGTFTEVLTSENNAAIYLRTTGPTALAVRDKQLDGHDRDRHGDGFGSPIGRWRSTNASPETLSDDQLGSIGIAPGKKTTIAFESGIVVSGRVEKLSRHEGKLVLITLTDCTAKLGDRVLFDPSWGRYDMAVGERIASVFNGAADKDSYNQVALVPKDRTIKVPSDAARKKLENLYQQVRDIRARKVGYERLGEIWETQQVEHADDWLLSMEIFEILDDIAAQNDLKQKIVAFLNNRKLADKEKATLIEWGFRLVTYHKTELQVPAKA
jgi:phenylalanine-4-hydroxylase